MTEVDPKTIILGISAVVALYSVYKNAIINRKRATVDLVLHQKNDEKLQDANKLVNPILSKNHITKYADEDHKDSEERKSILIILNNYEFIASGMREKAFDIHVYRRMRYGEVIRDWGCFKPFVYHIREEHSRPTLFQEFEWLANQFNKKKLKADSR